MDHQKPAAAPKSKNNKLMKFLPRTTSALTFQNPPFSPAKDKRLLEYYNPKNLKTHLGKGFSGPVVSIIPIEARRQSKNSSYGTTQEPTSPKVSCMGQIKCKHMQKKIVTKENKHNNNNKKASKVEPVSASPAVKNKKTSALKNIFTSGGIKMAAGRKSDASHDRFKQPQPSLPDRSPCLNQMRRFASSRDTFANFDWTAQITPVQDYYSDEERENHSDGGGGEEEEEVNIPFSAPLLIAGGVAGNRGLAMEPRKEINLWKRRTMAQPKPLQLHS